MKKLQSAIVFKSELFTVPSSYVHETLLGSVSGSFRSFGDNICDENFPNPSHKLIPSKQYEIKLLGPLYQSVSVDECLRIYEDNGAYFVGAQGLYLLWNEKRNFFPPHKNVVSLDKPEALYKGKYDGEEMPHYPWIWRSGDTGDTALAPWRRRLESWCHRLLLFCEPK